MLSIIVNNGFGYGGGVIMSSGFGFGGGLLIILLLIKSIGVIFIMALVFHAIGKIFEEEKKDHNKTGAECKCHTCNQKN